jgi:hypothetical protein
MIQFFPTQSKNIGIALDRRIFACRLASEFDEAGLHTRPGKSTKLIISKERRATILKS